MRMRPSKFTVGGQDFTVNYKDECENLGSCCVWSGRITIARNHKGEPQSESSMDNTFVHELVHAILDTMGEDDLSQNEKFVSTFASFLTEAVRTMDFDNVG